MSSTLSDTFIMSPTFTAVLSSSIFIVGVVSARTRFVGMNDNNNRMVINNGITLLCFIK